MEDKWRLSNDLERQNSAFALAWRVLWNGRDDSFAWREIGLSLPKVGLRRIRLGDNIGFDVSRLTEVAPSIPGSMGQLVWNEVMVYFFHSESAAAFNDVVAAVDADIECTYQG